MALINRDELRKRVESMCCDCCWNDECDRDQSAPCAVADILTIIDDMPAINLETEDHGYWMWTGDDELYVCSICGKLEDLYYGKYNFCPNCGKIMIGDDRNGENS